METLNQTSFVAALRNNRHTFSRVRLEGSIDISFLDLGIERIPELDLEGSQIVGDFHLADLAADHVDLTEVTGRGKILFFRPNITILSCDRIKHGWLSLSDGFIEGVNLTDATLVHGFEITAKVEMLELLRCTSPLSLFDEAQIRLCSNFDDCKLGNRQAACA